MRTLLLLLLCACGSPVTGQDAGGHISLLSNPPTVEKYAGNPIIDVDGNPLESDEQYTPSTVQLEGGHYWTYVKGKDRIYAWRSCDGEQWTLENDGVPVLSPSAGKWDSRFALEPMVVYDSASATIHMFYKGRDDGAVWSIGHATAPASDPTNFTKDPAPVLTGGDIGTALGVSVTDCSPSSLIMDGGTFYLFGYYNDGAGLGIFYATAPDWTTWTAQAAVVAPPMPKWVRGGGGSSAL